MDYQTFLERVIAEGIEGAEEDYAHDKLKREGSIEGFEACRGLQPDRLLELLGSASDATSEAYCNQADDYWRIRCREAEIEWVCNVVSAMLVAQGIKPIVPPTARGTMKAASILNAA